MRILIAVHGYPPAYNGGAERRAERTARGLAARGHDVCVVAVESIEARPAEAAAYDSMQDGVLVRRLYLSRADRSDQFHWSYDNPQTAAAIRRAIREWQPDVFHLFSGYLMSASVVQAAAAARVPVVVSLTDYWWLCHRTNLLDTRGQRCEGPSLEGCARCQGEMSRRYRLLNRASPAAAEALWRRSASLRRFGDPLGVAEQEQRARLLSQTLRSADALIAPSRYLAEFYTRHGIDRSKIRVWRQGVELDSSPPRRASPLLRVGYAGQIKYHKGVDLLLDAWAQLQGDAPRCLVLYGSCAGEEAYSRQLRGMIEQFDNALWGGAFQGNEVWQVLANIDVLVVPSRWVENSPNAILEAQAMGVPVVGSNLGGVAELVQNERNGLLFEVDNAADLARQLQRLIDEPGLLQRLSAAALPLQTVDEEIDQIACLYRSVAGRMLVAA